MSTLVIVESPTKAKTIRKFLGKGFTIDSSYGHIRDLPASAKEIPANLKKHKWASLGINVDDNYEPIYVISSEKKKVVTKLKQLLSDADELILATDEDREGEGISWHLQEVLKPKVPVKRMVFHEITQEAIEHALENFREIDMNLVNAQEARRVLDRLVGYSVSPVLWKKIAPGLSAGRVQSVAVQMLVQRERERIAFQKAQYWDLLATLAPQSTKNSAFQAQMTHLDGQRLATGKDFDESTGSLKKGSKVILLNKAQADTLQESLKNALWQVTDINSSTEKRSPAPPFITSSLQQEANRKFGMSARETMQVAQRLYENGFITYMRTDSTNLSSQAIQAARMAVEELYGKEYLFERVRTYNKKAKGAQEAHEAIRPAGSSFKTPQQTGLSGNEFKLYDLIWKRTMATQMADAVLEFTNVEIEAKATKEAATFKASGKTIVFPGFFRAYVEGSDDPDLALDNQESELPAMKTGQPLDCHELSAKGHETKPPARFTEATLIRELERNGVGRPSTYASIISTILDRHYALKQGTALVPTFTAFAVTSLLEMHFPDLVDSGFTSEMEEKLDDIARGQQDWIDYLDTYYKGDKGLKTAIDIQESQINPLNARKIELPIKHLDGFEIFVGKFGPYIQYSENGEVINTSLPADMLPGDVSVDKLKQLITHAEEGPRSLGKDPETGLDIFVLTGRFGPYVQIGEVTPDNKKPKRASLLKGMSMESVDLGMALSLLSLPRLIGNHPETGKEIRAGLGRFGPYVVHDGAFKSLGKDDDVLSVNLDRAIELLSQKAAGKRGGAAESLTSLKHPVSGEVISVLNGRYGPYIKYGKLNVSLSKNTDPATLTPEQAAALIQEKASKSK
jgi:DNA topoisomerase-1